jgi:hypothetical protein
VTLDLWYIEQPDGSWVVKCEDHKAWKFAADTFDEAKAGAPTSLKRHHSRHLQFRHFIVGTVST